MTECNSLWRYDIASGPLPYADFQTNKLATAAVNVQVGGSGQTLGLARGKNGYLYFLDLSLRGHRETCSR